MAKFTSRKFLLTIATAITAILTTQFPEYETAIADLIAQGVGLLIAVLSVLGYVITEARIDREGTISKGRERELRAQAEGQRIAAAEARRDAATNK